MFRILILGSSGLLGRQIYEILKKNKDFKLFHTGLYKRKINLQKKKDLAKFILLKNPNLIINCIAYTNIEACEKNYKISREINVEILREIFKLKIKKKLKFNFIHFSTDQFYNNKKGNPSKETSQIYINNNYCKHKRMSEIICNRYKALIFRTNFFGKSLSKNKSFSDWIYNSFKSKKKFYLFNDVLFNPLSIKTLARIIEFIINKKKFKISGIYNLGSKDSMYKNQFASHFAKKANIYNSNYRNVNVNKFLKIKRSNNMSMNIQKFEKKFSINLPYIKSEITKEIKSYI